MKTCLYVINLPLRSKPESRWSRWSLLVLVREKSARRRMIRSSLCSPSLRDPRFCWRKARRSSPLRRRRVYGCRVFTLACFRKTSVFVRFNLDVSRNVLSVAEQILRLAKCSVACDKSKMDVKPYALSLDPSVKFEVERFDCVQSNALSVDASRC